MDFDGKHVYSEADFDFEHVHPGDYLDGSIVRNFVDMLPPVNFRTNCTQLGEAATMRVDERTGNPRSTYQTFSLVTTGRGNNAWTEEAIWEYCGDCFFGENRMRGEKILDVEPCDCVVKMEGSND